MPQTDYRTTWPHLARCNNCDNALTATQVELAIEDCMPEKGTMDQISLCCPSFNDYSCSGEHDDDDMAYWAFRS